MLDENTVCKILYVLLSHYVFKKLAVVTMVFHFLEQIFSGSETLHILVPLPGKNFHLFFIRLALFHSLLLLFSR